MRCNGRIILTLTDYRKPHGEKAKPAWRARCDELDMWFGWSSTPLLNAARKIYEHHPGLTDAVLCLHGLGCQAHGPIGKLANLRAAEDMTKSARFRVAGRGERERLANLGTDIAKAHGEAV